MSTLQLTPVNSLEKQRKYTYAEMLQCRKVKESAYAGGMLHCYHVEKQWKVLMHEECYNVTMEKSIYVGVHTYAGGGMLPNQGSKRARWSSHKAQPHMPHVLVLIIFSPAFPSLFFG